MSIRKYFLATTATVLTSSAVSYAQDMTSITYSQLATTAASSGTSDGDTVLVTDEGRGGIFVWRGGNYSSEVTADPEGCEFVPASDNTSGTGGAWQRIRETSLMPEMCGAAHDGSTDDTTAVQAWINRGGGYASGKYDESGNVICYMLSEPIIMPDDVVIDGEGPNGTCFMVVDGGGNFADGTAMFVSETWATDSRTPNFTGPNFNGFVLDGNRDNHEDIEMSGIILWHLNGTFTNLVIREFSQNAVRQPRYSQALLGRENSLTYINTWSAETNTPSLVDGTGTENDYYVASDTYTRDLGSGSKEFLEGDIVFYDGSEWQRAIDGTDIDGNGDELNIGNHEWVDVNFRGTTEWCFFADDLNVTDQRFIGAHWNGCGIDEAGNPDEDYGAVYTANGGGWDITASKNHNNGGSNYRFGSVHNTTLANNNIHFTNNGQFDGLPSIVIEETTPNISGMVMMGNVWRIAPTPNSAADITYKFLQYEGNRDLSITAAGNSLVDQIDAMQAHDITVFDKTGSGDVYGIWINDHRNIDLDIDAGTALENLLNDNSTASFLWEDRENIYSESQTFTQGDGPTISLTSGLPSAEWYDSSSAPDEKRWRLFANGSGSMEWATRDDADTTSNAFMTISRNGNEATDVEFDADIELANEKILAFAAGPVVTVDSGAPGGGCSTGSLYLRTDGGSGSSIYVCESSSWVAK